LSDRRRKISILIKFSLERVSSSKIVASLFFSNVMEINKLPKIEYPKKLTPSKHSTTSDCSSATMFIQISHISMELIRV
jgi:hypothetical protein